MSRWVGVPIRESEIARVDAGGKSEGPLSTISSSSSSSIDLGSWGGADSDEEGELTGAGGCL